MDVPFAAFTLPHDLPSWATKMLGDKDNHREVRLRKLFGEEDAVLFAIKETRGDFAGEVTINELMRDVRGHYSGMVPQITSISSRNVKQPAAPALGAGPHRFDPAIETVVEGYTEQGWPIRIRERMAVREGWWRVVTAYGAPELMDTITTDIDALFDTVVFIP